MVLNPTGENINVEVLDNNYKKAVVEGIPIYKEEDTGDEVFLFSELIQANQKRIAEKYSLKIYNLFELAVLYANVKQKNNIIREKSRFNKMLFYIWKRLEESYGEDVLIFDEMGAARAGPIPAHLGEDIKELRDQDLLEIYLVKNGKKLPGSKQNWEDIKGKMGAGIECKLTKKGNKLTKKIWYELDQDIQEIIIKVKKELMYMDKEAIKEKVHNEFPEYKKNYTEKDHETFEEFLV